jgi:hypothetical protein
MATLRQLKGAAGTAGLMESCPRVEGFAMGIQFWRTPVQSLVLLALMLTGCATGGDLSTHDMPAIANRTYVLVGASSGFGQCLEATTTAGFVCYVCREVIRHDHATGCAGLDGGSEQDFLARIARRFERAEPTTRPSAQATGAFSLNPGCSSSL